MTAVIGSKPVIVSKHDTHLSKSNCIDVIESRKELLVGTGIRVTILMISAKKVVRDKKISLEYSLTSVKEIISCTDNIMFNDIMFLDTDQRTLLCYSDERLTIIDARNDDFNGQSFEFPEYVKFASYDKKGRDESYLVVFHRLPSTVMRVKLINGTFSNDYEKVVNMEDRIESLHPAGKFGDFHYVITVRKRLYVITAMGFASNCLKAAHSAYRSSGYLSDKTTARKAIKPTAQETLAEAKSFCKYFSELNESCKKRSGLISQAACSCTMFRIFRGPHYSTAQSV